VLVYGKQSKDDEYILQFDGINTREDAKRYQKGTLFVREEEREKGTAPEEDQKLDTTTENTGTIENQSTKTEEQEEFFISDLVGLEVFLESEDDTGNPFVGTVAGVVLAQEMCAIPGLGHDMLELNLPRGKGGTVSLRDELVLIHSLCAPNCTESVHCRQENVHQSTSGIARPHICSRRKSQNQRISSSRRINWLDIVENPDAAL